MNDYFTDDYVSTADSGATGSTPAPPSTPAAPKAARRTPPAFPWTAQDYQGIVRGSGAAKLASSAVAPLVAAARGYHSITEATSKDFAKSNDIAPRNKAGQSFFSRFKDGADMLVLPWFRLDEMASTSEELGKSRASIPQLRPSNPRIDESGRAVKYQLLTGAKSVLDAHPAATRKWSTSAPRTLIAEGMLKGDSALTALLRTFFDDELLQKSARDTDVIYARRRLSALLEKIPQGDRVAITSIVGVGNWRSNSEWWAMELAGKPVLIAFDGDVENNYNVWSMAADMFKFLSETKRAEPALIVMSAHQPAAKALKDDPKLGLDDYFAKHGTWADLEHMIQPDLPERPSRADHAEIGDWRISPDGTSAQEYVEVADTSGSVDKGRGRWLERLNYGGRVVGVETYRAPTVDELEGQPFGAGTKGLPVQSNVTFEIAWNSENEEPQTAEVVGPAVLLHHNPVDWPRHGAFIPDDVLLINNWPPKGQTKWLNAVKSHRTDETQRSTVWSTMGWVPVPGAQSQAFIAGRDVIAASKDHPEQTRAGVLGGVLTNAERFGLHDVYTAPGLKDPTGKFNLADDIREIIATYVTDTPWLDPKIAVTMLAIALRPAVPVPTSVASYFVGAPQKGKSWSARHCMSFWQRKPGVWKDTLPGSANDTFATTESAVARTPIWVVDDLAPSADRRTAEMQEAKIGDLIRAVHNKLGKRRMNRDMTERGVPTPMALTIITAENQSTVQSIRERVVTLEFRGLRMEQMMRADMLANKSTAASRITAATIRMFINDGEEQGWQHVVEMLRNEQETGVENARKVLQNYGVGSNDTSRPAGMAADLALGLYGLGALMRRVGLDEVANSIGWGSPEQWMHMLTEQIALGHRNKADVSPGRVLVDCIRGLLASGAAHIVNVDNPSAPPLTGENSTAANALMGWRTDSEGNMHPRGITIGWSTQITKRGTDEAPSDVIFVLYDDAFNLAQQKYPKRIPFGATAGSSWQNFWDLGLAHDHYKDDGNNGPTRQFRIKGTPVRPRGVPMSIPTLFTGAADHEED